MTAEKNCRDNSFKFNSIFNLDMNQGLSPSIYVFKPTAEVSIPIPVDFESAKDYRDTCLKNQKIKLVKTSNPSTVLDLKTILASETETSISFDKLDFLNEYQVQLYYTQNKPDSLKEILSKTENLTTCYGEPTKVRNLKASASGQNKLIIEWDQPAEIRSNKICYYEVSVAEEGSPGTKKSNKFEKSPAEMYFDISYKNLIVHVSAFNDKTFNGRSCQSIIVPDTCSKQGSAIEEYKYIAPTTQSPTTTKLTTTSSATTIYRLGFVFYISLLISLIF